MKLRQDYELVNHQLLRFFIGLVGILLGILAKIFAKIGPDTPPTLGEDLVSISHSYYYSDFSQNFFIGSLCFIGMGLVVYRGYPNRILWIKESTLSKIAGVSLIGVAFFPTNVDPTKSAPIHFTAAAIVFVILTLFCFFSFRKRALSKFKEKGDYIAKWRARVYTTCGVIMVLCMLAIFSHSKGGFPKQIDTVYWGETIALVAFGIAWLTASKIVAHPDERLTIQDIFL